MLDGSLDLAHSRSIDAGDEAFGLLAVGGVVVAEVGEEGGLFHVDAVKEGGGGGGEDGEEANPVAGVEADGEEQDEKAQVAGVADDAVEACALNRLSGADGYIDAEGFAEGEDGRESNGEAGEK